MPKSEIHPKWYPDAKVICNGEVVMTTGSTKPELHVDVWSGNHPFFTGTQKRMSQWNIINIPYIIRYENGVREGIITSPTPFSLVIICFPTKNLTKKA